MPDRILSREAAGLYLCLLLGGGELPLGSGPLPGEGANRPAFAELYRLGLVRGTAELPGGLAAVDPSEAFTRLLAGLDGRAATGPAGPAELDGLLRLLDPGPVPDPVPGREIGAAPVPGPSAPADEPASAAPAGVPVSEPAVRVLSGRAALARELRELRLAARTEYLAVVAAGPGGAPPLGWPERAGAPEAATRLLYAGSCPPEHGGEAGGPSGRRPEVRYSGPAPLDLRVVDRHTAVLALAGPVASGPAVVLRSEPVVGLLRSCFRQLWARSDEPTGGRRVEGDPRAGGGGGAPGGWRGTDADGGVAPTGAGAGAGGVERAGAGGGALSPFDRRVLRLLAQGHRDADIARVTATSVRTVRRRIAAVAVEFGTTSRFAIGVEAYRRGLVP
ncbi:hypothetical protein AB0J86_33765 [Micromonospora sp. NPDC049559]|uniref:helix-turn-helix transcriptional regulator n=1 Tax=Micromonospora sp. NPDC049559 TaxID=3155923 RepID=UPI00343D189F